MALHFERAEYDARMDRLTAALHERRLDAMLLFSPASQYWLTGHDSFGFAFFQCLVVTAERRMAFILRAADLRQARQTSIVEELLVWTDRVGVDPTKALKDHLFEMDLLGCRIGVEYDTPGLSGRHTRLLDDQLRTFATTEDASDILTRLRSVKSRAEIAFVRRAAGLADAAWHAGMELVGPGADEAAILAAMQGVVLAAGGDYAANEFVIGSGRQAMLVRSHSGRRALEPDDQLTLTFAGAWRRYHAAMMETVVIGEPHPRHEAMSAACAGALEASVVAMHPGHTFGDVYEAAARVFQEHAMGGFKLNAIGSSLGATFAPTWIDWPMFYHANPAEIVPDMVLFLNATLVDPESATVMSIGRSYLTTEADAEPLSSIPPAYLRR